MPPKDHLDQTGIDQIVIDRRELLNQLEHQWMSAHADDMDENAVGMRSVVTPPVLDSTKGPDSTPDITMAEPNAVRFSKRQLAARRAFDITVAACLLMAALPVMAVVALAVKVTSRGPVFFRHGRVGRGGEMFEVLKFRTMHRNTHDHLHAEPELHAAYVRNNFKLPSDSDRITPIGRLLRKSSLDELPQLINVLQGEMSLVGVRPLVSLELAMRSQQDQQSYMAMRPGITGLWQVTGRSSIAGEDRFNIDRIYVSECSPWLDLKILAKTPAALLRTHHSQ